MNMKLQWYLLKRRLGGAQNHRGLSAGENNLLLYRESNLDSLVTMPLTQSVYRLRYASSLPTALFHFIIGSDVQDSNPKFQNLTLPAGNRTRVKLFVFSPSLLYPCCGYKEVFLAFCIHVVDTKTFSQPFVSMLWIQRSLHRLSATSSSQQFSNED